MDKEGNATDEEKKLLRRSIARKATIEETDWWINQNVKFLTDKAKSAFLDMSDEDKFRVMSEGPLTECRDVTEILYGRVKRFMEMEAKLRSMANSKPSTADKPKEKKISEVALSIAQQMAMPILEEVPEHERRFGTVAGTGTPSDGPPKEEKVLIGTRQGVGGVIEALQKKYNMQKGQRAKVIAETKELWKMEGDLNVPKVHVNRGWKWVLQGASEAAKKKAEEQAKKKQEKTEADKRRKDEENRSKAEVKEKQGDSKKKGKTNDKDQKGSKAKKCRGRDRSTSSSIASSSSRRRSKPKVKRKPTPQARADSSDDRSHSQSGPARRKRGQGKRSSSSETIAKRKRRKRDRS